MCRFAIYLHPVNEVLERLDDMKETNQKDFAGFIVDHNKGIRRIFLILLFISLLFTPGSLTATDSLYRPQTLIKTGFQSYFLSNLMLFFCSYL